VEEEAIDEAIRLCHGNITRAAALLEINPCTIYRRRQKKRTG
jgi:two-component system repressor protein LuxO